MANFQMPGYSFNRTESRAKADWGTLARLRDIWPGKLVVKGVLDVEDSLALKAAGVDIPVHIGIAGPAKLQTLIKFAIACGVGPSLKVLQKRAMDVTKLLLPYEPTDVLTELAAHKAANPDFNIEQVHFFPLGGIKTNATWATENGGAAGIPASAQAKQA